MFNNISWFVRQMPITIIWNGSHTLKNKRYFFKEIFLKSTLINIFCTTLKILTNLGYTGVCFLVNQTYREAKRSNVFRATWRSTKKKNELTDTKGFFRNNAKNTGLIGGGGCPIGCPPAEGTTVGGGIGWGTPKLFVFEAAGFQRLFFWLQSCCSGAGP